jgi:hypothetical protein
MEGKTNEMWLFRAFTKGVQGCAAGLFKAPKEQESHANATYADKRTLEIEI